MFKHTPEQQEALDRLNCTYRCWKRTDQAHPERSGQVCEIVDIDTGKAYAEAMGPDEPTALLNALKIAEKSAKPLTAAQASEPADLQAQLAETRRKYYEGLGRVPSADDDKEEDEDPQPADRRSPEWRAWKARQTAPKE